MTDDKPRPRRRPEPRSAPQVTDDAADNTAPREDERIAKVMARAGLCSRRDAETWIAAGRVAVNGQVIASPALNVRAGDRVTVDGVPLPEREPARLFLFHKPRGVVTTSRDPEGRQTVFDVLPEGLPRVVSVGRLDINTEGLLLLTNDGDLARALELPATGWLRRYRVRANGAVTQAQLDALAAGVTVEGVAYAGIDAKLDRVQGANAWLTMGLREGKNREIKRVLEDLGLAVTRLIRLSFGPFELGELPAGAAVEVRGRALREALGEALAREAGLAGGEARGAERRGAERRGGERLPTPQPLRQDRPGPAPRAHVSALRDARDQAGEEGRRRTVRGATEDRRGRAVAVERVTSTVRKPSDPSSRNARRFAREAGDPGADRPKGPRNAGDQPRPRPRSGQQAYDAPRGTSPARSPERRAANDGEVRPKAPRSFGKSPRPSGGLAGRPRGRADFSSRGSEEGRGSSRGGDRPPRREPATNLRTPARDRPAERGGPGGGEARHEGSRREGSRREGSRSEGTRRDGSRSEPPRSRGGARPDANRDRKSPGGGGFAPKPGGPKRGMGAPRPGGGNRPSGSGDRPTGGTRRPPGGDSRPKGGDRPKGGGRPRR